jgi:hypothetical protein
MKKILFTGVVMGMAAAVYAQSSDDGQSGTQQHSSIWGSDNQSNNEQHGWGTGKGSAENGRMTEHGWVAPVKKDCSLNGTEISGSAQLRCMK